MRSRTRSLVFLLAALTPLGAQELRDALAAVPPGAATLAIYRDAATLDARFAKTLGPATPKLEKSLVDVYAKLELPTANRLPGPVVEAEFNGKEPFAKRRAYWLPAHDAKDFKAILKGLGAVQVKGGGGQVKRPGGTFHLAKQGAFAVATTDLELLRTIQGSKAPLSADLEGALPWLGSHDLVVLAPEAATKEALAKARVGLENGKDPRVAALRTYLKPWLDKAEASVLQAGIAVDFPADGTLRGQARAFFKPGSPLAELGAKIALPQGNPLEGLSPVGLVLGLGGPLPHTAMDPMPVVMPGVDPYEAAKLAQIQVAQTLNMRSMAFTLGTPSGPGAPLLGSARWLYRVDDVDKFFQTAWEARAVQTPVLAAAGFTSKMERDVLPGVPSFSNTVTLAGKTQGPLPLAQLKMIMTFMVGSPDHFTVSAAKADEHTILSVLGDVEVLKAALAGFGPGFGQDPGVAQVDALLPAAASWKLYLNLQNLRDLAQNVMESFTPGQRALPAVPAVPPVGLGVLMDASGVELDGVVAPSTLAAILAFSREVTPAKPAPKAVPVK